MAAWPRGQLQPPLRPPPCQLRHQPAGHWSACLEQVRCWASPGRRACSRSRHCPARRHHHPR